MFLWLGDHSGSLCEIIKSDLYSAVQKTTSAVPILLGRQGIGDFFLAIFAIRRSSAVTQQRVFRVLNHAIPRPVAEFRGRRTTQEKQGKNKIRISIYRAWHQSHFIRKGKYQSRQKTAHSQKSVDSTAIMTHCFLRPVFLPTRLLPLEVNSSEDSGLMLRSKHGLRPWCGWTVRVGTGIAPFIALSRSSLTFFTIFGAARNTSERFKNSIPCGQSSFVEENNQSTEQPNRLPSTRSINRKPLQ